MRNIYFDQDEMTLMAIFSAKTKRETVAAAERGTGRSGAWGSGRTG